MDGRWCGRDPLGETDIINVFVFSQNSPFVRIDYLGLVCRIYTWFWGTHSAMECGDTYISRFPEEGQYYDLVRKTLLRKYPEQPVGWLRSLEDDIKLYGNDYTVTETSCLDEDRVRQWLIDRKNDKSDTYSFGTNDCTDAVTDAMQFSLIDDEPKPSSDDCLQSSKCKSSWGAYYAVVEDILENQNFTLPSTVEKKVKMLNENKCKRYRCVIKYFPPIRRGVY